MHDLSTSRALPGDIFDNRTVSDAAKLPSAGVVLRPPRGRMGWSLALAVLLGAISAWVAAAFLAAHVYLVGVIYLLFAAAFPVRELLYLRNTRLFANPQVVGKRDWRGRTTTCPRDDFDRVTPAGGGGLRQLWFCRKDGTVAFKVYASSWSNDQIRALINYIGEPISDDASSPV